MSDEHAAPSSDAPDPIADGALHSLDPRHVTHGRLVGGITVLAIATGVLIAMIIVLLAVDGMPKSLRLSIPLATLATIVGLGILAWRWPVLEHRRTAYRVNDDGIEIRKGVYWRQVINVPRSRIQHTDVSQGPLERNFELSTLHVFTAGTEHSEVTLPGLAHPLALRIRDHLLTGDEHDAV
ncbi:MAG TPA: PH domain-containing protein [Candidatus Krumholzibacteria bacterium]|nr:PH domain-containing protein [Candidatus Krumholzibacteria bacterium]